LLNFFALLVFAAASGSAGAGEPAETVLLVATPELGAGYSHTVLIARRLTHERYVGLILNRPTPMSLAALFPDHQASKKVVDPLHFGGPVAADAVFALVRTKASPGEGSLQLAPDLFLATNGPVIDGIIEQQPDRARFYAGLVVWEPGELAAEIASGFWFARPADTDVVFRARTEGLWEELVQRARAVTASLGGAVLLLKDGMRASGEKPADASSSAPAAPQVTGPEPRT
jgi:putative transcriptional regulator